MGPKRFEEIVADKPTGSAIARMSLRTSLWPFHTPGSAILARVYCFLRFNLCALAHRELVATMIRGSPPASGGAAAVMESIFDM
jgi:hypothetical protein